MKYLVLLLLLVTATAAHAQITVSLSLKQRFYLLHEPVVATVNVTNLTGRDINFSDSPQYQWFSFRVIAEDDRMIPARHVDYKLDPLLVKAGETVKRSVNLNQLYDMGETGTYRIQAMIYFDGLDKFFGSKPTFAEINEGHVIWRQIAGIPEGQPDAGQMRVFTLLSHQVGEKNTLYVRIEDKDEGTIYCTFPIGRSLDNVEPQAAFDASNNLYVLHLVGTRAYVLTKIAPNGDYGGQTNYSAPKTRPTLRRTAEGALQIIGGKREDPLAQNHVAPPKLSDRPPGLPTSVPKN